MVRILKNNSRGKMQLAICSSGNSHFHLLRVKSNCSSHIGTKYIDVLFGVIHTRTLLANLLPVIVIHSNVLLTFAGFLIVTPATNTTAWSFSLLHGLCNNNTSNKHYRMKSLVVARALIVIVTQATNTTHEVSRCCTGFVIITSATNTTAWSLSLMRWLGNNNTSNEHYRMKSLVAALAW